jgi:hypothetical protein
MPDITEQIKTAVTNEPPLIFEPASVIATARRVRRRRRGAYAAAAGTEIWAQSGWRVGVVLVGGGDAGRQKAGADAR